MNILFVCKSNINRSQIAEAFFNEFSKNHKAISAGINANAYAGKKIKELSKKALHVCLKKKLIFQKNFQNN